MLKDIYMLDWPSIKFEPRDIWVGIYWKKNLNLLDLYVCILPCFPIHTRFCKGC